MYAGVPIVPDVFGELAIVPPESFAMPKSRIFTRSPLARSSSWTRKMLSGLRSRWITPWRWVASSTLAIWRAMSTT